MTIKGLLLITTLVTTSLLAVSSYRHSINENVEEETNVNLDNAQDYCDEDYCDSIVHKCLRTHRCSCDWKKDARCSKACIECLEEKFGKCCGCLKGLCPRSRNDLHASHVADLIMNKTDFDYFNVLTETEDPHHRWLVVKSPRVHTIPHPHYGELEFSYRDHGNNLVDISHNENLADVNCVVAFVNKELGMPKCRAYCVSMGAAAFRWFHNGCCECVGKHCLNYGIDEPRCLIDD